MDTDKKSGSEKKPAQPRGAFARARLLVSHTTSSRSVRRETTRRVAFLLVHLPAQKSILPRDSSLVKESDACRDISKPRPRCDSSPSFAAWAEGGKTPQPPGPAEHPVPLPHLECRLFRCSQLVNPTGLGTNPSENRPPCPGAMPSPLTPCAPRAPLLRLEIKARGAPPSREPRHDMILQRLFSSDFITLGFEKAILLPILSAGQRPDVETTLSAPQLPYVLLLAVE